MILDSQKSWNGPVKRIPIYPSLTFPGSGRSPGEGDGTTAVFLPGESHARRSLVGCGPRATESDAPERLHSQSPWAAPGVSAARVWADSGHVCLQRAAGCTAQTADACFSCFWKLELWDWADDSLLEPWRGPASCCVATRPPGRLSPAAVTAPMSSRGPHPQAASHPRYPQISSHWALFRASAYQLGGGRDRRSVRSSACATSESVLLPITVDKTTAFVWVPQSFIMSLFLSRIQSRISHGVWR